MHHCDFGLQQHALRSPRVRMVFEGRVQIQVVYSMLLCCRLVIPVPRCDHCPKLLLILFRALHINAVAGGHIISGRLVGRSRFCRSSVGRARIQGPGFMQSPDGGSRGSLWTLWGQSGL